MRSKHRAAVADGGTIRHNLDVVHRLGEIPVLGRLVDRPAARGSNGGEERMAP